MAQNVVSFSKFNWVGFDMDHTLVRYRLPELYRLVYSCLSRFMVEEKSYDRSLLDPIDKNRHMMQKGVILDGVQGNFLKLAANGYILRAYHGTRLLSGDEIARGYGTSRIWKHHGVLRDTVKQIENHWFFDTYFSLPGIVLAARLIDVLEDKTTLNWTAIWKDIVQAFVLVFDHPNFKNGVSRYFSELKRSTGDYVYPISDRLKCWLRDLKSIGVHLFLMTSSHIDYSRLLLNYSFGSGWEDIFDLIIVDAKKPGFFTDKNPFYLIDSNDDIIKDPITDLQRGIVYAQGSEAALRKFFSRVAGVDAPSILYVGDSIRSDIFPPTKFDGWQTVAIVEEMANENIWDLEILESNDEPPIKKQRKEEVKEDPVLISDLWGDFLQDEIQNDDQSEPKQCKTFWGDVLAKYSSLAVPYLDVLSQFPVDAKLAQVHSF
ncbi:5'-nucleotidase domain-containing protein 1-like [Corticium candelabrum]|uniref:5'-nucleotidase domain-containing protein 1-like n=1 Tax=Corticium candelabrum TaxID=121492 RepID=UPI002E25759B|nr:5'-nucleotidase domain-containing protein 1-like [Corticium candelabrum]